MKKELIGYNRSLCGPEVWLQIDNQDYFLKLRFSSYEEAKKWYCKCVRITIEDIPETDMESELDRTRNINGKTLKSESEA